MNDYQYRIDPDDPTLIMVRHQPSEAQLALPGELGGKWKRYMRCSSPLRAAAILAMLRHDEPVLVLCPQGENDNE